jgi:hypothetical protein
MIIPRKGYLYIQEDKGQEDTSSPIYMVAEEEQGPVKTGIVVSAPTALLGMQGSYVLFLSAEALSYEEGYLVHDDHIIATIEDIPGEENGN